MANWLEETKINLNKLIKSGYFSNWQRESEGPINFIVYPGLILDSQWKQRRAEVYKENADKMGVNCAPVSFYVFPSLEAGKAIGITPAVSFIGVREIYGHLNQSPGHELTHILLGELNSTDNLPANGLWSESICVFLDGTNTDRHRHTLSLKYPKEVIDTPWENWRERLPNNLYPLAGSITQYLDSVYGWDKILVLLKGLRKSSSNDNKLCVEIFGKKYSELQKDWRDWLVK